MTPFLRTVRMPDEAFEKVQQAVNGLLEAYQNGDTNLGEEHAHLPFTEVIEWKGMANIWNATVPEFEQTLEARKEEPLTQETAEESVEWLSELTALVFRRIKTTIQDGRNFDTPALFLVTRDREGKYKVVLSWWGSFPEWFQG